MVQTNVFGKKWQSCYLTGDRGIIPLFPMLSNSPILLGFLDSVEIMKIEIFHYSHTLQKNEEQNPVREP